MLAEFRDYLKSLGVAQHYSVGKIDESKHYSLGVYGMGGLARTEAFGRASSYDRAGVILLLHWNKNARETEEASRELFEKIRYIKEIDMGGIHVQYVDVQDGEPNFAGTDENGVYEYSIPLTIYYERS